jgi:hypothetical protein
MLQLLSACPVVGQNRVATVQLLTVVADIKTVENIFYA